MITYLSFASRKEENLMLLEKIRDCAARLTEESWRYELYERLDELRKFLEKEPVIDLVCWDITVPDALTGLEQMRRHYRHAFLMVISDTRISPAAYLKPSILPTSLLLKPLTRDKIGEAVDGIVRFYLEQSENDIHDRFVIDTREGKQYVPMPQIYYVEARAKKVYVRTLSEEYGFYGTIDSIGQNLPDNFRRCHRSYIVNMSKVTAVRLSENRLELQGGLEVPLSRSYRKEIKEFHKDGMQG